MMRATFICGGKQVPAARFRVNPVAAGLSAAGWDTRVLHGYGDLDQKIEWRTGRRAYRLASRIARSVRTAALRPAGPTVIQRLALPWWSGPETLLARRGVPVVFDFDDAVFLGSTGRRSALRSHALQNVWGRASHVVAGNSWLASHVRGSAPVTVIPTCIDTSAYLPRSTHSAERPVIGWIGTGGNLKYLEVLIEPLARLRREGYAFDVAICSDERDDRLFSALHARFIRWSPATELETLQSFDIGLMPLADNDWCRGKCSFKIIQYMAVGVPVVASAVGFNNDVVRDEQDGFLVLRDQWFEALRSLLSHSDARRTMGQSARRRAVETFDIAFAVNSYARILAGLQ